MPTIEDKIKAATSINEICQIVTGFVERKNETHPPLGRTSYVVTAKGDEVETAFKLMDAAELVPSNSLDGRINPDFPQELQPRDRTRVSSQLQISKMANELRPQQLTDSGLSSHGAPIVGNDNVVESGNGRSMAIIKAYSEGKADDYRQYLIDNAERFNLDAKKVKAMSAPVLVRERLTELDRAKFARDSNLSDLQQMSASETAWTDAERINETMIAQFQPSDTGNLLARTNQGFINSFLTEIGDNSTAGLLTEDGRPTKQLIERMQNAVFAKAYKNEKLVKLVSEEPDPEIRNILNALNSAASSFVEMQYLNGEAHKQATSNLANAIDTIEQTPPVFTVSPEQLETALTELESNRNARSGSLRSADRDYALSIIRKVVEDDRGNHPYSNVRGLADVAVYRNKQYPDLPIVVSTKVMKDLASHAISPEKIISLSKLNEILPIMRFTGKRYETDHNEQKHSTVKYWEDATVNFKVGDKAFEIGVKTRCIENGVKGGDSLSPYSLWDKDLMVESLASARGGISQGEPESQISQQNLQPSADNIQLDHELIKYLEVSDITITEKQGEPTLAENALESLVSATELVRQAKDSGQNIDELLAQSGLFGDNDPEAEALARFIASNNRSAKRMATAFKAMAEAINQELLHQGQAMGDMFGGGGATLIDILGRVSQDLESDGQQSGFLFESLSSVDELANEAATSSKNNDQEPTEAQKVAGNYKKGRLVFAGLPIAIENPKGSLRSGIDKDGLRWSIELKHHYGDISGTCGADGDPVDVFLGLNENPTRIYIVNQTDDNGRFDEHKVMLGFNSQGEAERAYLDNYEKGWNNYSEVVDYSIYDFKWWLRAGDSTKPIPER